MEELGFLELRKMQKILDREVAKTRKDGFTARKRNLNDLRMALDDEFNEWTKELPKEFNFKYWKEKEYSRDKELEELTDCLFFFLAYSNENDYKLDNWRLFFWEFEVSVNSDMIGKIKEFKDCLWNKEYSIDEAFRYAFLGWIAICNDRGFSKEEIINKYHEKWEKNMQRINKDWSINNGL